MAGRISQKDIEEIKQRTNLADVVGEYVQLKSAGAGEFKGRCPFHDEKSPSFTVSASKGLYHCFGCKEGGNLFDFVAKMDGITFPEVIEKLAGRIGLQLTYEAGSDNGEHNARARVLEANKAAAEFYASKFDSSEAEPGRKLLLDRGFDSEACRQFGLGWAPKGWSTLSEHLSALGFSEAELVSAGLASKGYRGLYDKFRGRVIWPIRDATNSVIGFGARKIFEDDKGPKYLNTSETSVYHKSRVLYGLDLAKRDIAKSQQVVIVEGYTDVMACHLAGVTNAVATCGTAFGDEHIRILNRILSSDPANPAQVIFNFDPDEAGQKAAMRAFNDASKFNAQTFMAIGPEGLDPSDLRTARGDDAVREMIASRKPLLEFAITRAMAKFDLDSREGQVGAARAAAALLAQIEDSVMRGVYERFVSDATKLERNDVSLLIQEAAKRERKQGVAAIAGESRVDSSPIEIDTAPDLSDPTTISERWLLVALSQYPSLCSLADFARIGKTNFSSPWYRDIARALYQARTVKGDSYDAAEVMSKLSENIQPTFREILMVQIPANDDAGRAKYAAGVLNRALERAIENEKNQLRADRRSAEAVGNDIRLAEIDQAIVSLDAEIHALRRARS